MSITLTASGNTINASGSVTISATPSPVTTPFIDYASGAVTNVSGNLTSANAIVVFPFTLPYSQTVTNIICDFSLFTSGDVVDWGIYNTTGVLQGNVGSQTLSTTGGVVLYSAAVSGGAITLAPGTYLFALTSASGLAGSSTANFVNCQSRNGMFIYDTSTTSSGSTLPNSITVTQTTPTGTEHPTSAKWGGNGNPIPLFMLT